VFDSFVFDNGIPRWIIAAGVAVLAFRLLQIARNQISRRLAARAPAGPGALYAVVADLISRTHVLFLIFIALYVGSLALNPSDDVSSVIQSLVSAGLLIQGALWVRSVISYALERRLQRKLENGQDDTAVVAILGVLVRIALWIIVILLILENLGVRTDGLPASLGIIGVAVALATQNILSDQFASFSIALDKPFAIGDFIIVGDELGAVEHIGIKTTRVRSLTGEQMVFSNNDLLTSRIHNFKRMSERRMVFALGVTYETPYEKLQAIPCIIQHIVESQTLARFDQAHFKEYSDFALIFEVVYYVATSDCHTYMDVRQQFNLEIYRRVQEEEMSFACPTQTLYVSPDSGNDHPDWRG
jgi:small-conductance mechanosensitive channel